MPNHHITIAGQKIGADRSPYIIAELSGNHNGKLENAMAIMEAAKESGADAVKLQTYTPDTMTIDHDGPGFRIEGTAWNGRTLYDLYREAHTPWEWHEDIFAKGRELGITVFSTPFDETAVDFLESLGTPAYKIASFELVDLPLIELVAATGKPVILSTGMADFTEITEATSAARDAGCRELAVLHCVSGYPTPPDESNLRTILDLRERLDAVIGLSDHTLGVTTSLTAIALGASIIEKHFTIRRADGGPDAGFSLEPDELKSLTEESRTAWKALGSVNYEHKESEKELIAFRRSLYVVADMAAGDTFSKENVRSIRPGHGLATRHLTEISGRKAKTDIKRGSPLTWELIV